MCAGGCGHLLRCLGNVSQLQVVCAGPHNWRHFQGKHFYQHGCGGRCHNPREEVQGNGGWVEVGVWVDGVIVDYLVLTVFVSSVSRVRG